MLRLTEDRAKAWLRADGLPVPEGHVASSPDDAAEAARALGGAAVVKALVAAGRRGKAGAVRPVSSPADAAEAARDMLGREVSGVRVERVYVEARVAIASELYVSYSLEDFPPNLLLSRHGGVDIEETRAADPSAVIAAGVDVIGGVKPWHAVHLWRRAGVSGRVLPLLGQLTARLFRTFQAADAITLEINPLAVDGDGKPVLVGATMGIDDDALNRQAHRLGDPEAWMFAGRATNPRERSVFEANLRLAGGMIRYTELDGDIGLVVLGGGAGLLQHDLITALGGRPANHSDQNGINVEKLKVLIRAVLDNPNVRSLLVGSNHQQMTRTDRKIQAVIEVLKERRLDATRFPVVIRMFGPGEEAARALAADVPGVRYVPRGTTLEEACRAIVEATRALGAGERVR